MTCDEERIVAFLHGLMSDTDEQAFDEHLLTCESCWRAVREDRLGRLAVERLRMPAPPGLGDRVAASVRLARPAADGDHLPSGRSHRGRLRHPGLLGAGLALAAAVLVAVLGLTLPGHTTADPPQIARVAAMMSPGVDDSHALQQGEQFEFGGQALLVRSVRVDGVVVLVATSSKPFPVPDGSHVVAASARKGWMATRGPLGMYGVNEPSDQAGASMFLVSDMPATQLPAVAARLDL